MNNTSERLANLSSQEKRELVAQLLRQKVNQATSLHPLSYGQQALWFLYQSAPENTAYNTAFTANIRSHVDVSALKGAFQSLIDRHPSLRTTFTTIDGKPVQEIHGHQEVCFHQIDASAWSWDELNKQVVEDYRRPFVLEKGPVIRVSLFTRSEQEHILLVAVHHIVYDGWSLWILLDEFRKLYSAEITGTQTSLPPLTHSYIEHIRKQTEMLAGPEGERLWDYWRQQLSGELPVLNLPTDYPRPPMQTLNGTSYPFKLNKELTKRFKELARTEGVTLYMLLLAVFQVLLHRYTSQEDILVGAATTGRNQVEFAQVVGYFVNPVVLRADLAGNPPFNTFLRKVRQTVLDALKHQDYPFPSLVKRLQPNRDPSRSPLFQAMFVLQKPQQSKELAEFLIASDPTTRVKWGELEMAPFRMGQQEGQFDLALEMIEVQKSLHGVFQYNTDLFHETTIARMTGHFKVLSEGIVVMPEQRLSELPLLTEAERHQILREWNDTTTEYPRDRCVHELFEAQVERTLDAVAVVFEEKQMTYRELNAKANQLAHYLRSIGVEQEVLVGICVERSLEMLVGLLGILKAGGAYVPLDLAYPQERLAFMLEDTETPVLLTQQRLIQKLPSGRTQIVCLDSDWEMISLQSKENPLSQVKADNLVYIMYTSGSTGKPKGTSIPHRGIVRLVKGADYVDLNSEEVFLQLAPLSFDASTLEIWGSLLNGARLVIMPPHTPSLEELGHSIQKYQITTLWLTAGLFHLMVDQRLEDLQGLRQLLAGGDVLSIPHVRKVLDNLEGCRLINGYGPTENTTFTCCFTIPKTYPLKTSVPIGRPIANTQVYILDSHLQPVPIGVPGELYIGGDGLARGYFRRPKLTREKFIPDQFSEIPGKRLYKTGDLARYLPDGNIEFLGRMDYQVKIRGFRVELGEIEAILAEHPAVTETVVLAREDQLGDKRLVAYVVEAKEEMRKTKDFELREYLREKLPDYMIPSAFVMLEALPLTPNGKVDRCALPAPDRSSLEERYVAPRTSTEKVLSEIWAEVLDLERVGIHDNFFEIGGHSLLATQLISRVHKTFNVDLPLRSLFEDPTIANLAESIETIRWLSQKPSVSSNVTENREEIEL